MKANRIAAAGMLAALALILGWIDNILPLSSTLPGLKLGLANLAVIFALYHLDPWHAAAVSATKVLLSTLLFGSISGLIYSASGAVFSFVVMLLMMHLPRLSVVGVSAAGGAVHIIAQFCAAAMITSTPAVLRLMPPLLALGTLTGALLGIAALLTMNRMPAMLPGLSYSKGERKNESN